MKRPANNFSYSCAATLSWVFTLPGKVWSHWTFQALLSIQPLRAAPIPTILSTLVCNGGKYLNTYDVIVIGTGAGGGMAIKTLCEAGLKVCALNAGRQLEPAKDFREHKLPYDMKFRGFGSPQQQAQSVGYMDSEYVASDAWEHEIAYTTTEGTHWTWPRSNAVGGKTNFWGRSAARMSQIDFKAASRDGLRCRLARLVRGDRTLLQTRRRVHRCGKYYPEQTIQSGW